MLLQASRNLHLWVDINDAVSGRVSNRVDNAWDAQRFFRLMPWTPPAPLSRIVLLGDSTVAELASNNYLVYGWGGDPMATSNPMLESSTSPCRAPAAKFPHFEREDGE